MAVAWLIIVNDTCSSLLFPLIKTTIDTHPRNHSSLARDYFWGIHSLKNTTRIPQGRETSPTACSSRRNILMNGNQMTFDAPWECWCAAGTIFQVQGQSFSLSKERRKVLVEPTDNTDPEEKNLLEEMRLHTWTLRSHPRRIKSNQGGGESWDFRSQRLNFLAIHRQKLNLEEFDAEVSITRKKKKQ